MIGIYQIKNAINHKVYRGSSKNIKNRWKIHIRDLANGNHHNIHLQRAWAKYGQENFIFEIIEIVEDENNLKEREQYFLDKLSRDNYNIARNVSSPMMGENHSPFVKMKIGIGCLTSKFRNSKLTSRDVLEIRKIHFETRCTYKELANRFSVTKTTIGEILRRETWCWLVDEQNGEWRKMFRYNNPKLSEKDVRKVKQMKNKKPADISNMARKLSVAETTIRNILNGLTYKDVG